MLKMLKERTWILVVILTAILSCVAIGLTGAKYSSQFTGTATMQTAKFDVSVLGSTADFTLTKGDDTATASYSFSVTSNSEVGVSYNVILTCSDIVLPNTQFDGLEFSIIEVNDQPVDISPVISDDKLTYTFSNENLLKINADGGTNFHTLAITATNFDVATSLKINIKVVATQTQPIE